MNSYNKHLLSIYQEGWNECFDGIDNSDRYETEIEKKAYKLGWAHYIIGDDVTSIDSLSEEEILKQIKG